MKLLNTHLCTSTALTLITAFGCFQNAYTQEVIPTANNTANIETYVPGYFTQYAPRTALDMAVQIPGFSISGGGNTKRGLGQGGANVLINGKRISGKTSANDRLSRINATSVVRIEILDGARLDIPGLSGQVANVVYKTTTINGNWEWTPGFRKHLKPNLLGGEINVSGNTGEFQWSLSLKNGAFRFGNRGLEFRSLTDGTLIETRDEVSSFSNDTPTLATSVSWTPRPDHVFNLNAELSKANFDITEFSGHTAFDARGDNNQTSFSNGQDNFRAEIGADYAFPFGPKFLDGTLKIIGVARYLDSPSRAKFITLSGSNIIDETRFSTDNKSSETILRSEYSWTDHKAQNWQVSFEGAYNRLNANGGLQILDIPSGQFIDIPLSGSSAIVSEKRGEATLAHTWKISSNMDIQTSVGFEYSQISQNGAQSLQRSFFRPKGFIQASYKVNDNFAVRPRIAREVGQLNFNDFISSVSLRDELSNTGNANLVPEQIWASEVEFEKMFTKGNIIKVRLYADFISDLVDRIPVGTNGDAVGNIDSARRYGIDIDATLKGEAFGLDGVQLDTTLDLRKSSVDDPLTGRVRRLNRDKITFWEIGLRHDIKGTDLAYGGTISDISRSLTFRLDTINSPSGGEIQSKPKLSAFIEHKNILGLKLKTEIVNILNSKDVNDRQLFTNRRDLGQIDIIETSRRNFGQTLRFNVSGTF
ncbi:MAG: hypothetical protein COB92_02325 [Robiginitomaculum sp.]|nr:MAG: hypothetical protein COB92_02325 [Robiginitomaculum sp.]